MSYHLFGLHEVTAAKPHRCIWCGEGIAKGEIHGHERSVYDGAFQDHRWHPECREDAEQSWRDGDDAEFTPYSAPRPARPVVAAMAQGVTA